MGPMASKTAPAQLPSRPWFGRAVTAARDVIWGLDQRRLVITVLFLIIFAFDFVSATDIDLWWHLKTGELIAATGLVPVVDSYSYTAPRRLRVPHRSLRRQRLRQVHLRRGDQFPAGGAVAFVA